MKIIIGAINPFIDKSHIRKEIYRKFLLFLLKIILTYLNRYIKVNFISCKIIKVWIHMAEDEDHAPWTDLTEKQFLQIIDRHFYVVVDYGAAWCGPCRNFSLSEEMGGKNTFKKVMEGFKNKVYPVMLYAGDFDCNTWIKKFAEIEGIPAVLFFLNGKFIHLEEGELKEKQLKNLIKKIFDIK